MNRRIVITGLGVIAANGIGKEDFWQANVAGRSNVRLIDHFDARGFRTKIAAQVTDFNPLAYMSEFLAGKVDRFVQFALAASMEAGADARLNGHADPHRVGVAMGAGLGGMFFYEKQILTMQKHGHRKSHPASIPRVMPNAPAAQVAMEMDCQGPNLTISTACASATHAITQAYELIKSDKADVMLAGGTEAPIIHYNFAGFDALQVMSTNNEALQEASRPFDKNRDGFVMGEGAGILILEELKHAQQRSAPIYAEIAGYGLTCGANHVVMPKKDGEDAARCMTMALKDAGLKPADIDYINAHGTSTQANDIAETKAIKDVFQNDAYNIPVSSTKSMIGHTFGACGAMEAIICALCIDRRLIPPTINYQTPDPQCDLDYVPNEARSKKVSTALSNSFAFGSNNTTLILKEYRP